MGRNLRPQIRIPDEELSGYLAGERVAVVCSLNADGSIHATPLWYVLDDAGRPLVTTPTKSRKAVNLRRDARVTWLVESGESYEELQGAQGTGVAEIIEDLETLVGIAAAIDVKYRGTAPSRQRRAELEAQMRKRIGLALPITAVASWDHGRLAGVPPAG